MYDFFFEEFMADVTMKNCFVNGGGEDLPPEKRTFANIMRCSRNGAYKVFERYLQTILPRGYHGWLNTCIVNKIRTQFPDNDGHYLGFRYSVEHMKMMLEQKEQMRLEDESRSSE